MVTIKKVLIGQNEVQLGTVDYYMIKKIDNYGEDFYGVEVAETAGHQMTSYIEYFSQDAQKTSEIVTMLYEKNVAAVHLQEVIDAFVQ